MNFEDPLFHIHLNVDFPFNLTGILYFPKLKKQMDLQKNRIHLYSNQVFITDNVENIVPDFLTLLHGVIDSPDIPLNVCRSYLQEDANVKKISGHISKKVSDKLAQMFKKDRPAFEAQWDDLRVFVEYGMLTDEKFAERAQKFFLFKDTDRQVPHPRGVDGGSRRNPKGQARQGHPPLHPPRKGQHSYVEGGDGPRLQGAGDGRPLAAHVVGKLEQDAHRRSIQARRFRHRRQAH